MSEVKLSGAPEETVGTGDNFSINGIVDVCLQVDETKTTTVIF